MVLKSDEYELENKQNTTGLHNNCNNINNINNIKRWTRHIQITKMNDNSFILKLPKYKRFSKWNYLSL